MVKVFLKPHKESFIPDRSQMLSPDQVMNVLVSLAMSYKKLIQLYPIYGLYSCFVLVFVYAIFGSLRQLTIGQTCSICFTFVLFYFSSIVNSTDELYIEFAILLVLLV